MSTLSKRNLSIFLLLILAYVSYVNAYNLFYVPKEGRQIELSGGELYKPSKYFEKVDVYSNLQTNVEKGSNVDSSSQQTYTTNTSKVIEQVQVPKQTSPPNIQSNLTLPTSAQDKEQRIPPISIAEVQQLSSKLRLSGLSDSSILELRISQSYSEVFTIHVQGRVNVASGETSSEDIEVWIDRSAFKEILAASDVSSTTKRLASEGKISVKQKVSTWTLYRKGYKSLAEELGLM